MKKEDMIIEILNEQGKRLDSIDNNLAVHMMRTDLLEDLHKANEDRIEKLEAPKKARQYLLESVLTFGKFAGAILAVLGVLKYIGKI